MKWAWTTALVLALSWPMASSAEKVLRVGLTGLPPAKGNPYFTTGTTPYTFFTAMYDPLVQIDDAGSAHPWLALDWRAVNETTWVITLRPGVTFSNGEPFNAEAVKVSFDFLLSDAAISQTVSRDIDFIAAARALDDLTVEITTKTPHILLPRYLAGVHIVAPRQFTRLGLDGFAHEPVGTGPFKVDRWEPEKIELSAFRGSWRAPMVDRMEALALPEAVTRIQALETRRVDVATNIQPDDVGRLRDLGMRFHKRNPTRVMVVSFDVIKKDSPFKDARVRQAMNYAVDRGAIVAGLLHGLTEATGQPAAPSAVGYVPDIKPYPYDPAKAKALLAEAGYPNGFSVIMEQAGGQLANDAAVAQQIAADLAQVGVKMEIQTITFPQVVKAMTVGPWKGHALATDYATAPSLDMMRAFNRHSCGWAAPWFCDPAIEPKIAAADAAFDEARRTQLTQEVVRHYHEVAAALFLYPAVSLDGLSPRVTRWEPWNDNFMYHLADVTEDKP
jgi:peptide/nickel transport system substrate-binding protein